MKNIVLGVSSSVSIYKACEIIRGLQGEACEVRVIMTRNAAHLISPRLFSALTGKATYVELFEEQMSQHIPHIDLARETELLLLAPATANLLGKLASGIADDFLTTFYLAVDCPVLVAPAMNENMYLHPQTQANIRKLKAAGAVFLEPVQGYLACGVEGWGRLASPEEIVQCTIDSLKMSESLKGQRILITAGPTREYLDPIRYLSNRSSGRMGYLLAEDAVKKGAEVCLVSGPSQLYPPRGARFKAVETANEMHDEVQGLISEMDVVIMAAAVSDFSFVDFSTQKIKKRDATLGIALKPTPDILEVLGKAKKKTILVGFAAETEDVEAHALEKIRRKNLDLIVANDVSQPDIGFDVDQNQVSLYTPKGLLKRTEKLGKREISRIILDEIEVLVERSKRK